MANVKITSLPVAIGLDGTEQIEVVQAGTSKRTTVVSVANFPRTAESFVLVTSSSVLGGGRVLAPEASVTTITDNGAGSTVVVGIAALGVSTAKIAANAVTDAKLRQGTGLSVIGNAGSVTANVADIVAASDNQVLRRSGTAIGFGAVNLASSAAVTGTLAAVNGGTGAASFAVGDLLYANTTTTLARLASSTANQVLMAGGVGVAPAYSTATYPSTTAAGTINASASANAVTATATPTLGVAGSLLGSLSLAGNTSGTVTIKPQAAAGTYNFNLPTSAGTSGQPLLSGGGVGAPMTFGTLGLAAGGTAADLSATVSNGGIVYSGASALAILAGTANASRPLLSGASTTPSWAAINYPASATSGGVAYFSSTTAMASSGLLTANALVIGGGAGVAPSTIAAGTNGQILLGQSAAAPAFGTMAGDASINNAGSVTIANAAVTYAKMQNVSVTQRVIGRNTAGAGSPEEVTATQVLDWIGATQGQILYRNATTWTVLATGTAGQLLQTGGAAANPSWVTVTATNATQADMEAATSTTTVVTPGRTQFHPGVCKAWIKFDGTGTPTAAISYNVTSITDNGVGSYGINFTTAFSTASYCLGGTASTPGTARGVLTLTTGGIAGTANILTVSVADVVTDFTSVHAIFFGDQ